MSILHYIMNLDLFCVNCLRSLIEFACYRFAFIAPTLKTNGKKIYEYLQKVNWKCVIILGAESRWIFLHPSFVTNTPSFLLHWNLPLIFGTISLTLYYFCIFEPALRSKLLIYSFSHISIDPSHLPILSLLIWPFRFV